MEKKDVLEELSYSLSEKERITLLERISKSAGIAVNEENEDTPEHKQQEKNTYVENELRNLSWFRRFILMIRCRISSREMADIVISQRMKQLKKSISRKQQGVTGFESRNLTPEFGEKVFNLYSRTLAFRDIYRKLWLEPGVYESGCLFVIRSMYEDTKNRLDEFISMDELVELYADSGKKEDLVKEVDSRIKEYSDLVPEILYSEIEKSIAPMYKLKDLVLFPYTAFFQKFSFTPNRTDGKHFFKNASAMLCLDHLKSLYIAVMSASELDEHVPLNKFLIEFIKSLDDSSAMPEGFNDELRKLINSAKLFARSMPILEIIQYFRKEPYLRINYSTRKLSFKEFYTSVLHRKLKDEIIKLYPEVQKQYIEREIERIFEGKNFQEFRNYRMYASIDHQKMGLPFFTHTKSLNVLYNYIKSFYQSNLSDVIAILEKGILSQNRITRDRMIGYSVALQELEDKISSSDKSLAPDEEDGKVFHKLRMTLVSDTAQQRMYRSLVVKKNREVKSLIDWGDEALGGLEKIFDELIASEANAIKVQLNKHYLMRGKSITLVSLLKRRSNELRDFRRLMAQITKMELD
ncbi:MAG: DUF5312 family protein [Spirochaetales bacterium]|uniref:DUF5312 family protein n=1 Tax=Candidatus Thalassospirochaeta sargassi TaxID=3119039 RepID=A0AAJ1IGL4_9SPIO|nr:DUF5312 family protein [Spirochaetales bacterium]